VNNEKELLFFSEYIDNPLIQEYILGNTIFSSHIYSAGASSEQSAPMIFPSISLLFNAVLNAFTSSQRRPQLNIKIFNF
ncbi:hypothetical protein NNN54_11520, partial [Enterococcus faecium]|nr:hypothetical protein [Enterococcus faecium]